MRYLIDAGNTLIKFARYDGKQILSLRSFQSHEEISRSVSSLQQEIPKAIWLSSTLGPEQTRALQKTLLSIWPQTTFHLIETNNSNLIKHCYTEPDKLGTDRWLALLAVQAGYKTPAVIIDAGTVITIDLLHKARHIGGWLCPGLNLMKASLHAKDNIAKGLQSLPTTPAPFGTSTSDCIDKGCRAAALGLIEKAIEQAIGIFGNRFHLYITGGDADMLASMLNMQSVHIPKLVFEGMTLLINNESGITETV